MKQTKTNACMLLVYIFLAVSMHANAKEKIDKNGGKQGSETPDKVSTSPTNEKIKPMAFFSGMVLTKVTLQAKNSLAPFADVADEGYEVRSKELTGLLIFHIADKESKIPNGAYVWDGEKWQVISQ